MLREARVKGDIKSGRGEPGKRPILFPGLCQDAEKLGVHRNHLYLVLSGRRVSHSLKRRYRQLKEAK